MVATINLSAAEKRILWYFQNQPDIGVERASKRLKIKSHRIHYALSKFRQQKGIRRIPVISTQALGYHQFDLLFSLGSSTQKSREKILEGIAKNDHVTRLLEAGGEFEYRLMLLAKRPAECLAFLEQLGEAFNARFERKQIFITNSYIGFGRKYLTGESISSIIALKEAETSATIDELDHRILRQISDHLWLSNRDHAEMLGIGISTLAYRLKMLVQRGIFHGFILGISPQALGRLNFQLLIQTSATTHQFTNLLERFARNHDLIVNLIHYIGSWDFSLQIEPEDAQDVVTVMRDLQSTFSPAISRILPIPNFRILKNINYPFMTLPRSCRQ